MVVSTLSAPAHAEWKAVEKTETYAISGKSGPELYASIGERGPVIRDDVRTIAHTNFKLTWSRNYVPKGGTCTLVSAVPKLTITYTLPKPKEKLPEAVRRNWDAFYAGVRDHEKVHGRMIEELTRDIEAATVGLSAADDPKCTKIRAELERRLKEIHAGYKKRNSDFDRDEMGAGGNIQRLILKLVNDS